MRWAIKHKSGRTLFVTSDEFIANNRREMGWIVEEVKMTSKDQFNEWFHEYTGCDPNDNRYVDMVEMYWMAWQASRLAIEIQACPSQTIMARILMTIIASKLITQA